MKRISILTALLALLLCFATLFTACDEVTGLLVEKGDGIDIDISIVSATVNSDGHLIIVLSDGQTIDAGRVVGADGAPGDKGDKGDKGDPGTPGKDGVSVVNTYVDTKTGHLMVVLSNGQIVDAGQVTDPAPESSVPSTPPGPSTPPAVDEEAPAFEIDGVEYTVEDACLFGLWELAKNDVTVKVIRDLNQEDFERVGGYLAIFNYESNAKGEPVKIVFDFQGHTVTVSQGNFLRLGGQSAAPDKKGDITVKNINVVQSGTGSFCQIYAGGNYAIENSTFTALDAFNWTGINSNMGDNTGNPANISLTNVAMYMPASAGHNNTCSFVRTGNTTLPHTEFKNEDGKYTVLGNSPVVNFTITNCLFDADLKKGETLDDTDKGVMGIYVTSERATVVVNGSTFITPQSCVYVTSSLNNFVDEIMRGKDVVTLNDCILDNSDRNVGVSKDDPIYNSQFCTDNDDPLVENGFRGFEMIEPPSTGNTPGTSGPVTDGTVLPDVNYSGTEFRVLSKVNSGDTDSWGSYDIVYVENASGLSTELKEAIKLRNDQLKNDIGVMIKQISGGSNDTMYTTVGRSVARGNDEYDMVIIGTLQAAKLAQKGYLASIQDDLKYIDADGSHYDQRAMEQFSVNGKNYFFVSDITVANFDATWVYYFNEDLVGEYKLEHPYKLLAGGEWTIDKLLEMAEKATSDNGDHEWTKEDSWGIAGHGFIPTSMFFGAGMNIARADESGEITLTMNDPQIAEFMNKATQLHPYWARYSVHGSGEPFGFAAGDNYSELVTMYGQGRTLFMGEVLALAADDSGDLSGNNFSVGILPTPKLNKEQAEYYTPAVSSVATVTCVPISACGYDLEKASVIIESWARISKDTVQKVYVERYMSNCCVGKGVPAEVVNTVLDSVSYDLGDALGWGNLTAELQKILYEGDADFASMYKIYSPTAQFEIKDFMRTFK